MSSVAFVFASSYGQTRAIVERLAETVRAEGHVAVLHDLEHGDPGVPGADLVVLASGVYANQHHDRLLAYLRTHGATLDDVRTVLVSVSLAAAIEGDDGETMCWDYVSELSEVTGWEPGAVVLAAGALNESAYDPATKALLRVASWRLPLGIDGDVVLTDDEALDAVAKGWF